MPQQCKNNSKNLNLQTHPHRRQNPNIAAGVDAILPEIVGRALPNLVIASRGNLWFNLAIHGKKSLKFQL